jgi:hypothetical protein
MRAATAICMHVPDLICRLEGRERMTLDISTAILILVTDWSVTLKSSLDR